MKKKSWEMPPMAPIASFGFPLFGNETKTRQVVFWGVSQYFFSCIGPMKAHLCYQQVS